MIVWFLVIQIRVRKRRSFLFLAASLLLLIVHTSSCKHLYIVLPILQAFEWQLTSCFHDCCCWLFPLCIHARYSCPLKYVSRSTSHKAYCFRWMNPVCMEYFFYLEQTCTKLNHSLTTNYLSHIRGSSVDTVQIGNNLWFAAASVNNSHWQCVILKRIAHVIHCMTKKLIAWCRVWTMLVNERYICYSISLFSLHSCSLIDIIVDRYSWSEMLFILMLWQVTLCDDLCSCMICFVFHW
jgi:hypothetical protein